MIKSFRDVIDLWPTQADMADAIGVSVWAVKKWRQRDSIPAEWWMSIVQSSRFQPTITLDILASLAARHPREAAE